MARSSSHADLFSPHATAAPHYAHPGHRRHHTHAAHHGGPSDDPSSGGVGGGGGDGNGSDSDESIEDFDAVEDVFHPLRQIRLRKRKWKKEVECSQRCVASKLHGSIPALSWLPRYKPSRDFLPDLVGGLILSVVCVPQAMAYAILAGLPPIYGLYACLVPPLFYTFFGGSKALHIGPVALVSLLVANAIADIAPANAPAAYTQDMAIMLSIMVQTNNKAQRTQFN